MGAGTALAEQWKKAFENGDVGEFVTTLRDDAVQHHPMFPSPAASRDEIRQREAPLFAAFSEITLDVRTIIEDGDTAVIEAVVGATNTGELPSPGGMLPATGRRIALPMVSIVRFDEAGLVAEERRYMDVAGFMAQLGIGA